MKTAKKWRDKHQDGVFFHAPDADILRVVGAIQIDALEWAAKEIAKYRARWEKEWYKQGEVVTKVCCAAQVKGRRFDEKLIRDKIDAILRGRA